MNARIAVMIATFVLTLATGASAGTLSGTVTNLTTSKPAPGDEVIVLTLAGEMKEVARTRTDSAGRFTVTVPVAGSADLIRVVHQGVSYHQKVDATTDSTSIAVYDVADDLAAIAATVHVQRYEAHGDSMAVSELIILRNASSPPKTLITERSFEIHLPQDARVNRAGVQSGNGPALLAAPRAGDAPGHFYFKAPLRPGETRLQIDYHLPYNGERVITTKMTLPVGYFAVVVPKSMRFDNNSAVFRARPETSEANVHVTGRLTRGNELTFRLSGSGQLPGRQFAAVMTQAAEPRNRAGGGLGAPIRTPDPLHGSRWYLLGAMGVALATGGMLTARRGAAAASHKRTA